MIDIAAVLVVMIFAGLVIVHLPHTENPYWCKYANCNGQLAPQSEYCKRHGHVTCWKCNGQATHPCREPEKSQLIAGYCGYPSCDEHPHRKEHQ